MRKVLEECPSCQGKLAVTRMSCTQCDTVILSQYEPCTFCKLSPESMKFLEIFVKKRGNVKEIERDLGTSYWAIRNQINDLLVELGFEAESEPEPEPSSAGDAASQRRDILEQLNRGEISAAEAAELLGKIKGA